MPGAGVRTLPNQDGDRRAGRDVVYYVVTEFVGRRQVEIERVDRRQKCQRKTSGCDEYYR